MKLQITFFKVTEGLCPLNPCLSGAFEAVVDFALTLIIKFLNLPADVYRPIKFMNLINKSTINQRFQGKHIGTKTCISYRS